MKICINVGKIIVSPSFDFDFSFVSARCEPFGAF